MPNRQSIRKSGWTVCLRICSAPKVLLNFFQKIAGSRGRAPDALRTASRSEAFRAQPAEGGLLARDERGTLYPVKRFFRVNCRVAARGGFLQVKKPPSKDTEPSLRICLASFPAHHAEAREAIGAVWVRIPPPHSPKEGPLRLPLSYCALNLSSGSSLTRIAIATVVVIISPTITVPLTLNE